MKVTVHELFIESKGLFQEFEQYRKEYRKEYNRENAKKYYSKPENWERKKLLKRVRYNTVNIDKRKSRYEELKKEFGDI